MTIAKSATCGNCRFFQRSAPNQGECYGLPPVPIMLGVVNTPMGQQPQIVAASPSMPANRRACSLHAPGLDLSAIDLSGFGQVGEAAQDQ